MSNVIKPRNFVRTKLNYFTVVLFINRDTYIERQPGESSNDRNDRAIREAAHWYQAHLADMGTGTTVVLVTNDADNRAKAKEKGLSAFTSMLY